MYITNIDLIFCMKRIGGDLEINTCCYIFLLKREYGFREITKIDKNQYVQGFIN